MKVLWTLSPTAVLDFMTKSWAAPSTDINIALASLVQYMCVHKPASGHVYIYPNGHEVRKANSTESGEKPK